jgi:hypothetical protein
VSVPPEIIPPFPDGLGLRPVPGFPGYAVTRTGEVWGYCRLVWGRGLGGRPKARGWRELKQTTIRGGWRRVQVNRPRRRSVGVHTLVLLAYVGPCPVGMECCHGPGGPADNRVANLRWDTPAENGMDARKFGPTRRGEKHPLAKLTAEDVKALRRPDGPSAAEVARLRGVSPSAAMNARAGRTWRHVG